MVTAAAPRPTLAVWKFASCDGCQLTLLDCEDELLALTEQVEIAYFLEVSRATVGGPYDLSLVEGSITTADDIERIQEVRTWPSSTPLLATSPRWPRRHRSRPTSRSTSSCVGARSTRASSST